MPAEVVQFVFPVVIVLFLIIVLSSVASVVPATAHPVVGSTPSPTTSIFVPAKVCNAIASFPLYVKLPLVKSVAAKIAADAVVFAITKTSPSATVPVNAIELSVQLPPFDIIPNR